MQIRNLFKKNGYIVLFLSLAATLRLYRLGYQSLWIEEINSLGVALKHNVVEVIKYGSVVHPPLYYLLLHYWSKLGTSEFVLRLPSAIFGIITVFVIFKIGQKLFDEKIGIIAAFLFSINPFHIWYSQEVRMYSLLILLSTVSVFFFVKILKENSNWSWIGYFSTSIFCVFTHFSAAFLILFQILFLFLNFKTYRLILKRMLIYYGILASILTFLFFHYFETIINKAQYGVFNTSPIWVRFLILAYTFYAFSVGYSLGPSVPELHRIMNSSMPNSHFLTIIPLFIIFAYLLLLGIRGLSFDREKLILIGFYLLFPVFCVYSLVLVGIIPIFQVRYVSIALPAFILLLSVGIKYITNKKIVSILLLLLVTFSNAGSLKNYYFTPDYFKQDIRGVAEYIELHGKSGDIIFTNDLGLFTYYYHGNSPVYIQWFNKSSKSEEERFSYIESCLVNHERVWLVPIRDWVYDVNGLMEGYFEKYYPKIEEKKLAGIEISLFGLGSQELVVKKLQKEWKE